MSTNTTQNNLNKYERKLKDVIGYKNDYHVLYITLSSLSTYYVRTLKLHKLYLNTQHKIKYPL